MSDLIERQELLYVLDSHIEHIRNKYPSDPTVTCCINLLEADRKIVAEFKSVEAEPVRTGRWIREETKALFLWKIKCSECGVSLHSQVGYNYCPNCGAKMEG